MNGERVNTAAAGRIASLDIGRMAACWYVMLFHASIDVGVSGTVLRFGYSGVQFFMMLSGYVLARPYLEAHPPRPFELRRYAIGRVARIIPPYYVVVLLGAALAFIGRWSTKTPIPRADLGWHVLAHLALVHTFFEATHLSLISVLWSLGLEWQYYVILPLLLIAFRARRPLVVMAAAIVVTVLTRFWLPRILPNRPDLLNGFGLARLTEFAAGVALACLLGRGWSPSSLLVGALALGGVGIANALRPTGDREFAVQGVVLILFVLLRLHGPVVARSSLTHGLQFLGEVSYSTYLVHTLAGKMMLSLLSHGPHALAASSGPRLVMYVLAGQLAGVAFYYVVEKPTTRGAAALFRRLDPAAFAR